MINVRSFLRTSRSFRIDYLLGKYIWTKGSLIGPSFKIPFMGPFFESVNPKFWKYKAKWDSGDLSCVSVFHKYGAV